MTAEEIRRQKADVLLESREALERSAALRARLRTTSELLAGLSEWIAQSIRPTSDECKVSAERYSRTMSDHINPAEDARFAEAMNLPATLALLGEYCDSLRRLEELRKTKADLGLD